MSAFMKMTGRSLRHHIVRMLSLALIVMISVGFSAGIGMATDKLDYAIDAIFREREVSDLLVKSTLESGFTDDQITAMEERYGQDGIVKSASLEFRDGASESESARDLGPLGSGVMRTSMTFDGAENGVSRVYFFEGSPEDYDLFDVTPFEGVTVGGGEFMLYVERQTDQLVGRAAGEKLTAHVNFSLSAGENVISQSSLDFPFVVCGTINNPLHFATRRDISVQFKDGEDFEELRNIFYVFDCAAVTATFMGAPMGALGANIINDVYIRLPRKGGLVTSSGYKSYLGEEAAALSAILREDAKVLTVYDNFSFGSLMSYSEKVRGIGYVMMVVFLAVTLLVLLSTMTRTFDEERGQLACLMTQGYSQLRAIAKYLILALVGTLAGIGGAYAAGLGLAYVVYINFFWVYELPPFPSYSSSVFFVIVSAVVLGAVLLATLFSGLRRLREKPADLLRPKAPRPGKKVILEKIPLLWNRLSFKYKSTCRNVLRYKMRFAMTVVAVLAASALVFAGFAVLECCLVQKLGSSAMVAVSAAVLVFAALLDAVVIYTLTCINISERKRELATLMVLGYNDAEVAGYMFREIYITCAIGILLGIPAGALLCFGVFGVLAFGSVAAIGWYVWVFSPLVSLLCVFAVTALLIPKILRVDMNESLKAAD